MGATARRRAWAGVSPPDFALHWATELGAPAQSVVRLQGGINNRVYRCDTQVGQFVIKGYAPCAAGRRDRMQAEVAFLRYASQVAPDYVPQLLYTDVQRRCVVLEHIEGETYREGVPPAARDESAAVEFFRKLNADPEAAKQAGLPSAAEGFLRLTEHIANVRERIATMQTAHLPVAARAQAAALLCKIKTDLEAVAVQIDVRIKTGGLVDGIEPNERCVSPSDFGFHNAIRTPQGIKFIDFEFAGWDDPAKAVADFALQPRIPIHSPGSMFDALSQRFPTSLAARCAVLVPVLKLKWGCIMLSVLNPERLAQLVTLRTGTDPDDLVFERLEHTFRYLQLETPFGLH